MLRIVELYTDLDESEGILPLSSGSGMLGLVDPED